MSSELKKNTTENGQKKSQQHIHVQNASKSASIGSTKVNFHYGTSQPSKPQKDANQNHEQGSPQPGNTMNIHSDFFSPPV